MAFVSSLTTPRQQKSTALQNLLSQPHRLFFFAGIVQGLIFMILLGLQYAGLAGLDVGTGLYHSYALIFIVFTQFFAGFLLTTFPRYLSRPSAAKSDYLPVAGLINGGGALFAALLFVSAIWVILPMIIVFAGYVKLFLILLGFQTKSTVTNKEDTAWMLRAFAFGIAGQILFAADLYVPLDSLAMMVSFYLYLFFIVITVSQKMIPFFAANSIKGYIINKSRLFLLLMFGALAVKVFFAFFNINTLLADIILFGTVTYELLKWKLPFRKTPPILWVLFLSVWWAPIGFGLFVLQDILVLSGSQIYFGKAPLHALTIGYLTTVLIGFGTRIVLGHSGRAPMADTYTVVLFGLIQVMALVRIMADFYPNIEYLYAIFIAVGLWLVIFGLWSKRYMHILFEKQV